MAKKRHFNKTVAEARGKSWLKNLKAGKMEARANPSKLAEIRTSMGLRQADIAARIQMSLSSYCAVERGHRLIKDIFAKHIAAELGVKIGEIFEPPLTDTVGGIKWRAIVNRKEPKNERTRAKTAGTRVRNSSKGTRKKSRVQRRSK